MQLKLLWDLQEIDLAIRAVKQKIEEAPGLSGVEEAKEELKQLEEECLARAEKLKEDRRTLKNLEMRTQKIVDDRKNYYEKMYDGTVTSVKELEQMQRKMELLAEEKQGTEDEILTLMESIEEQEALLDNCERERERVRQDLQEKEAVFEEDLYRLKGELAILEENRERALEKIEKKYIARYNLLAEKYQGQALAEVADELCGGCRVFISSALRGHLYNPDAMVYCENCGRLLIKLDS